MGYAMILLTYEQWHELMNNNAAFEGNAKSITLDKCGKVSQKHKSCAY